MLISRLQLSDLAQLGQKTDWPREPSEQWPAAGTPTEYVLVWRREDAAVPATLIIPTSIDDFFAWTSTYVPHLTPFSSFVHVVDRSWRPKQPGASRDEFGVFLGLWFAEATASGWVKFDPEEVGLSDCIGCLTYCLLQNAITGPRGAEEELPRQWSEARHLLGLVKPRFHVPHLLEVWQLATVALGLTSTATFAQPSANADRTEFVGRALTSGRQASIAKIAPGYEQPLLSLASGPLEDRVRQFKQISSDIRVRTEIDDNLAGIILGFGLSEISGGSFRHAHLVGPSLVRDARPLFWYGCFEAAKALSNGGGWLAGGMGLRLRREVALLHQLQLDLDCDISLEELRVLGRGTAGGPNFGTKHSGLVRVLLQQYVMTELLYERRTQSTAGRLSRRVPDRSELPDRSEQLTLRSEQVALPAIESYRRALSRFLQQGDRRVWFASPMKFFIDQSFDAVFDFQKVAGLAHAELLSVPTSGPFVVKMTAPAYHHLIRGRRRTVSTSVHELSIPVEYIEAEPWRDSTHGYICISLKANLVLNWGQWSVDRP